MDSVKWDESVDVLVVGSGASGMSAALTASFEGEDVLLIEKTAYIGGSTAVSGGAVWLPLNAGSAPAGHPDTYEKVWEYLSYTVGNASPDHMKKAYLDNGAAMLSYMVGHQVLGLAARSYSPDYYSDRPGASMGGRAMDPVAFDGKKLGRHFKELRNPLKEFVVLGGMMITLTDANHLLGALKSRASFIYSGKLVLKYWMDRIRGYHRGTRLLLGNALAAQLFYALLRRKIPYRLNTKLQCLHRNADGHVVGATVEQAGAARHIHARKGVVVATGGFPWNEELRAELYPQPTGPWSMSPKGNCGEGIRIAQDVGAAMGAGHVSPAFWAPVSLFKKANGEVVRYPHLVWDRAKPGLIAVNAQGKRFVNESASYHEFVRTMLKADGQKPFVPVYLLCDHNFMEKWGLGLALPGGRPRQHLVDGGYLVKASSIAELASRIKVDPEQLTDTVARYNQMVDQGEDTDFGKGSTAYNRYLGDPSHQPNPCLGALKVGPFYAVEVVAGDIGTACGIQTNEHAQALDADGRIIPGLFVVGNDMQSVMGGAYPGPGITLGPGLTFGWVAGQKLAHD